MVEGSSEGQTDGGNIKGAGSAYDRWTPVPKSATALETVSVDAGDVSQDFGRER